MSTYKNLKIYKTHDDAARAAANQGFKVDGSRFLNRDYATCECGETEVAAFFKTDDLSGQQLTFGICSSCGEDYE